MFYDRHEAGQVLANKLKKYKGASNTVIYALPRGGVVIGEEVARALELPLGLIVTRKITHPGSPEYAIGAISENTEPIFNELEYSQLDPEWVKAEIERERAELMRRKAKYTAGHKQPSPTGKVAIIVDDGIATGMTMQAAVNELREQDATKVIVAAPVAPADSIEVLKDTADAIYVVEKPVVFRGGVGAYYDQFEQTTDVEVLESLYS